MDTLDKAQALLEHLAQHPGTALSDLARLPGSLAARGLAELRCLIGDAAATVRAAAGHARELLADATRALAEDLARWCVDSALEWLGQLVGWLRLLS